MKERLQALVRSAGNPLSARNAVREYVQARVLEALQRSGAMVPLAFYGGTALRFLFSWPRHSEDLDFALERPERGYDFSRYLRAVRTVFRREGVALELKVSQQRHVHSAFVRFPGLWFDLGLSARKEHVFSVKVEVDTRPPEGAVLQTTLLRRHVLLHLQHHDRASLLAGKLHAVLQRPFLKGRDLFDLLWVMSDPTWPSPNLVLLNHALAQTGWSGPMLVESTWRAVVAERVKQADWDIVLRDVRPFLEPSVDERLLTRENLLHLLRA